MAIIYKIAQIGTDKCYVGHTTEQPRRWWGHRNLLRLGKHHSYYLQNAWNMYGEDAFSFEVVEECLDEDKVLREQYYIDTLNSCYNSAPAAGSVLGYRFTDEQRARCGVHRVGFKESAEATEARTEKVRQALLENPYTWLTDGVRNMRHPIAKSIPEGWYPGRTFDEEHKAATLAASSGPRSPEARANIKSGHATTWDDPDKRAAMLGARRPFGWWTDGTTSKRVAIDETPPEGWRPGRAIDAKKLVASRDPTKVRAARNPELDPAKIAARLEAGETIAAIAQDLGVALSSIHRARNKAKQK
jgi:group I intron endonuclease